MLKLIALCGEILAPDGTGEESTQSLLIDLDSRWRLLSLLNNY